MTTSAQRAAAVKNTNSVQYLRGNFDDEYVTIMRNFFYHLNISWTLFFLPCCEFLTFLEVVQQQAHKQKILYRLNLVSYNVLSTGYKGANVFTYLMHTGCPQLSKPQHKNNSTQHNLSWVRHENDFANPTTLPHKLNFAASRCQYDQILAVHNSQTFIQNIC